MSELASNGEAFDYVAAAGGLDDKFTRGLFLQVLAGVEHMHNKGVAHRDIKLENIFLDENCVPKVADFGLAKAFAGENGELLTTKLGTKNYMAPELYSQEKPYDGPPVDVFALGAILYMIRTATFCFN